MVASGDGGADADAVLYLGRVVTTTARGGGTVRIAAVQSRPVPGDIAANLERHLVAIGRAAAAGGAVAMLPDDARLERLQRASDDLGVAVAAGLPLAGPSGVTIGMALFRPGAPRVTFAKRHLHADEEPWFVPGEGLPVLELAGTRLAFAICYEISVPEHPARAAADGAKVYLASVAKTPSGVAGAIETLGGVAERLGMSVVMANCVGPSDGAVCGGRSSAWTARAGLGAQLPSGDEGLLLFDVSAGTSVVRPIDTRAA